MNIAQALKEKNRIAGEIAKIERKIQSSNRYVGEAKKFDTVELGKKLVSERAKLVALKTRIAVANVGIARELVELAEAKAQLKFLNSLEHYVGLSEEKGTSGYGEFEKEIVTYSQISVQDLEKFTDEAQKLVNDLQDKVDAFNATTSV